MMRSSARGAAMAIGHSFTFPHVAQAASSI
jgi:hypothetical protein